MVDQSFFVARAVLLLLASIMIVVSCIQNGLAFHTKLPPIKRNIHLVLLALAFNFFLTSIDPYGVYQLIPYKALWMITPIQGFALGVIFSMIIYSHFHAHYLTLHQHTPPFLKILLVGTNLVNLLFMFVGTSLTVVRNQARFQVIRDIGSLQFFLTVLVCDLRGALLVYRLIKQAQAQLPANTRTSHGSLSDKPKPPSKSVASYDRTLSRMKRFHFIMTFSMVMSSIFFLQSALKEANDLGPLPEAPDRFTFSPGLPGTKLILSSVLGWALFTWWAWIPIRKSVDEEGPSNHSGHSSRSHGASLPSTPSSPTHRGIAVLYATPSPTDSRRGSVSPTHTNTSTPNHSRRPSTNSPILPMMPLVLPSSSVSQSCSRNNNNPNLTLSISHSIELQKLSPKKDKNNNTPNNNHTSSIPSYPSIHDVFKNITTTPLSESRNIESSQQEEKKMDDDFSPLERSQVNVTTDGGNESDTSPANPARRIIQEEDLSSSSHYLLDHSPLPLEPNSPILSDDPHRSSSSSSVSSSSRTLHHTASSPRHHFPPHHHSPYPHHHHQPTLSAHVESNLEPELRTEIRIVDSSSSDNFIEQDTIPGLEQVDELIIEQDHTKPIFNPFA